MKFMRCTLRLGEPLRSKYGRRTLASNDIASIYIYIYMSLQDC